MEIEHLKKKELLQRRNEYALKNSYEQKI